MYSVYRQRAFAALVVIFSVFFCLIAALPVSAEDFSSKNDVRMPFMEEIMAQPFTVSVISRKYGVFNATINMKRSLNFPERLRGELIPIGQQRTESNQLSLEHFRHSRPRGGETPSAELDAHPSLVSFDIHLDFSGASAGRLSLWMLPADAKENKKQQFDIETGDVVPTASVPFSFHALLPSMVSNVLSDMPEMARQSTGNALLSDGSSVSFTMRLFTEYEFSTSLILNDDTIWIHGYAAPNGELFPRSESNQPWWHVWALIGLTFVIFILQVLLAMFDTQRKLKANDSADKTLPAKTKKNN